MAKTKKILLKQFRVSHGDTSQDDFADAIGVSRNYYSRVETGKLSGNVAFWKKLQDRFGVSDGDIWRMIKE